MLVAGFALTVAMGMTTAMDVVGTDGVVSFGAVSEMTVAVTLGAVLSMVVVGSLATVVELECLRVQYCCLLPVILFPRSNCTSLGLFKTLARAATVRCIGIRAESTPAERTLTIKRRRAIDTLGGIGKVSESEGRVK